MDFLDCLEIGKHNDVGACLNHCIDLVLGRTVFVSGVMDGIDSDQKFRIGDGCSYSLDVLNSVVILDGVHLSLALSLPNILHVDKDPVDSVSLCDCCHIWAISNIH